MSAETNFSVGDEVLFLYKDGTWRQGTVVNVGERTATISWSDRPNAESHLTSTIFDNIKKIENKQ